MPWVVTDERYDWLLNPSGSSHQKSVWIGEGSRCFPHLERLVCKADKSTTLGRDVDFFGELTGYSRVAFSD